MELAFKSSHVGPYEGRSDESWKTRPKLAITLNPGYPSLRGEPGTRIESGVSRLDGGSAGRGNAVTSANRGTIMTHYDIFNILYPL